MPFTLTDADRTAATGLAEILNPGQRICLTTHVNPDGDGLGSEAGLAHLLRAQGCDVAITNPSLTVSYTHLTLPTKRIV